MSILKLDKIEKRFGGVKAVTGVSFECSRGEVVGLIGPNGAGKTTVLNLLSGFYKADAGQIMLDGKPVAALSPQQISRLGIRRTFQNNRLFNELTALDNVAMGLLAMRQVTMKRARRDASVLLERVGLAHHASSLPGGLPYAFRRRIEIARALAGNPKVLLLDEPAAGMHTDERHKLADLVQSIALEGTAVLVIEHDMALIERLCTRVVVMNFGQVLAEGTMAEVRQCEAVRIAYFGRSAQ
jgi:ABC-type branched-subunit amino acid transport system ATPase component